MSQPFQTNHSLLRRACDPGNEHAWKDFVETYSRFIFHILGQVGIDSSDRDDLCQEILVALTRDLPSYDRSRAKFRNWLSVVIRNAAFSHLRKLKRRQLQLTSFGDTLCFDDPGDGPSDLDQRIEEEWAAYIASLAMERIRGTFQGHAVKVLEMSLDGISSADIAELTGLSVPSVYTLRKRVKKQLYLEIRAITAALEP